MTSAPRRRLRLAGPGSGGRRRLLRGVLVGLAIIALLRVALSLTLPWLLGRTLADLGLDGAYDRLRVRLLHGDLEVRHLTLRPRGRDETLADLEYCRLDLSLAALLRGRAAVSRLEIDGLDVVLTRGTDGQWRGWEGVAQLLEAPPDPVPAPPPSPRRLDSLQSALRLDALRVQHLRLTLRDAGVTPPVDTRLDLTLRLSDLGSPRHPARCELRVAAAGILDLLQVEAEGRGDARSLAGSFTATLRNARPAPVAAYLRNCGIATCARRLDGGFEGTFNLELRTPEGHAPETVSTLALQTRIEDLHLKADGQAGLTLGRCDLRAALAADGAVRVESLGLSDGRLHLVRDAGAGIAVAGVYLRKPLALRGPRRPRPVPVPPLRPARPWSVGPVDLEDVELLWTEARVPDVPALAFRIAAGRIGPVDPNGGQAHRTPIRGLLHVPGVVGAATVTGACNLIAADKTVEVTCALRDVTPAGLGGYLTVLGLVSEHEAAALDGSIRWSRQRGRDGRPARHSVALRDVRFVDGDRNLAALDHLRVEGITWDRVARRCVIERIAVQGDRSTLHWDAAGRAHLWGFGRCVRPRPLAAAPADGNEAPATSAPPARPRAEILCRSVAWDVGDITLIQEGEPNTAPRTYRAGLTGSIETLWLRARQVEASAPGHLDLRLTVPGLIESLGVTGSLSAAGAGTGFDLSAEGRGLDWPALRPLCRALHIRPRLGPGRAEAKLAGRISFAEPEALLDLDLRDLRLHDAERATVSLDRLHVEGLRRRARGLTARRIAIDQPVLTLERDPNGALIAGGFELLPRPAPEAVERPRLPAVCLDAVSLDAARVVWRDRTLDPPVATTLTLAAELTDVNTLDPGVPARLQAHWELPGVMAAGTADASLRWSGTDLDVRGRVAATGVHPELPARYLRPGSRALLRQGRLDLAGHLQMDRSSTRTRLRAQLTGLDYREANEPNGAVPWLHLDEALLDVEQRTDTGPHLAVAACRATGLEARVERGPEGHLHVFGLALAPEPSPPPVDAAVAEPNRVLAAAEPNQTPETPAPAGGLEARPTLRAALPHITVADVNLAIRRLDYRDLGRPTQPRLSLEDVSVANAEPLDLLGDSPATRPPAHLILRGRIRPALEALRVDAYLTPFADPSALRLDLSLSGLRGSWLTDWFPALADRIDATALTDGRLTGSLELAAAVARRRAVEFDLRQAFGATLTLRDLRLTTEPNTLWIGLDEAHVEAPQIDLARRRFALRRVELLKPRCRMVQEPNGLRLLNVLLRRPEAASDAPVPAPVTAPPAPVAAMPRSYQVRLDQLLISGLDFVYRDQTVAPPTYIPLNGLDLDLRGVVLPTPAHPGPLRFNTIMTAGNVPVTEPNGAVVDRFLLQEFTASGHVTPGAQARGWIKAGLKGFDLRALRGLAGREGITIRQGRLDAGLDLRIDSARRAGASLRLALGDLSVRDSSEGVVAKVLLLPVTLDVATYVLQGLDGRIRLNVPFTVDWQTLSPRQLKAAFVGATAAVVGKAIATSPVKVVAGTGKLVGSTGRFLAGGDAGRADPAERPPVDLIFEPGATALNRALQTQIDLLARRLRTDRRLVVTARHRFGLGDVLVAERLANPSDADNQAVLQQLRTLRAQVRRERVDLAARTRAAYGAGDLQLGGVLSGRLAALDAQAGTLEEALDNFLERLGPGSTSRGRQRTREAALSLAGVRLRAVREALRETGIADIDERVQIAQPSFVQPEDNQPGRVTLTLSTRNVR